MIIGGRTNSVGENLGLEIYDTENSEWSKFPCIQRFRHSSWLVDNFIYIFGGFELESPNIPTDTITKLNMPTIVKSDERILAKIMNYN